MVDQYTKNKIRLLSMLHDLYIGQKRSMPDTLPFATGDSGIIVLSPELEDQLDQEGDCDFAAWVRENISSLS
jgi:hypothetical protein